MSKTPTDREKIRRQAAENPEEFSNDELIAAVCKYFCRGMTPAEIRKAVLEKLGISLTREQPYRLLSTAGQRNLLSFKAPLATELENQIARDCGWLKDVRVVRTAVSDDVSYRVAETLLDHVCALSKTRSADKAVHIGFAGGKALRKTAKIFSEMLREPRMDLPQTIIFHAIVAGFQVMDPSTDPNGFFNYFAGEMDLQVQAEFIGLPAPVIVKSGEIGKLRTISYLSEAFDSVKDIDIIVTSAGGHWQQGHSSFFSLLSKASPQTVEQLTKAGCIGDLMWRPLGKEGPLKVDTDMRTVTLIEPSALPEFIKRGKSVILLLGPCGTCGRPKDDVLGAILAKRNLITHLVVDSRSARAYLAGKQRKPSAD